MNILINLYSSQKNIKNPFHGGNEYANRLADEVITLNAILKHKLYFFCYTVEDIDKNIAQRVSLDINSTLIEYAECSTLEIAIKKYNIDRLFDPLGVNLGVFSFRNTEIIYTIHGLRPLEIPTDINEFFLESKLKYILKRIFLKIYLRKVKRTFKTAIELQAKSKKLIVVSNHTKNTIIAKFNVPPNKINVFYSPEKAYSLISQQDELFFFKRMQEIKPKKYFLIVSSKRWIKNTYRAVRAFDELISQGLLEYKVVLTGANPKVKSLIKNKSMFCPLGYVETKELEILYKNAFVFVYPSLNEGFGYPPLEAMKYGTPVIASMIASIPEVIGDSALGFNPFSISEMKARVIQIQNDDNLYEKLKVSGIKRYRLISSLQKEDLVKLVNVILS